MDSDFDPLDYILPPPTTTDKQILIRREVLRKIKSFFKRLWQIVK